MWRAQGPRPFARTQACAGTLVGARWHGAHRRQDPSPRAQACAGTLAGRGSALLLAVLVPQAPLLLGRELLIALLLAQDAFAALGGHALPLLHALVPLRAAFIVTRPLGQSWRGRGRQSCRHADRPCGAAPCASEQGQRGTNFRPDWHGARPAGPGDGWPAIRRNPCSAPHRPFARSAWAAWAPGYGWSAGAAQPA